MESLKDMAKIKNYRFGFDIGGLVLFVIVMIPNVIWFAVPAGNDILRNESITPVIDAIASVFQVIMVAALCLVKNITYRKPDNSWWKLSLIVAVGIYFIGWCMYYGQIVNPFTILVLCIAPCMAFILWAISRKNGVALMSAIIFMICHVVYGFVNFIC